MLGVFIGSLVLILVITWAGSTGGMLPGYNPDFKASRANLDTFWLTFWASLLAGVVVGIFGTLGVGLLLWWLESWWTHERDRRTALREFSAFKERLKFRLSRPPHYTLSGRPFALSLIADSRDEVLSMIDSQWLSDWREKLPDEVGVFAAFQELQTTYATYVIRADTMEARLIIHIEDADSRIERGTRPLAPYASQRDALHVHEGKKYLFCYAILLDVPPAVLKVRFGYSKEEVQDLQRRYAAVASWPDWDETIRSLLPQLREAFWGLHTALQTNLPKALGLEGYPGII